MPDSGDIKWLQEWYFRQCNGGWEHQHGVRIETLDNPGWKLEIDLQGSDCSALQHAPFEGDQGETDWIVCRIEGGFFRGYGDAMKLGALIAKFREWVDAGTGE